MRNEVQRITDEEGVELPSARIHDVFQETYVKQADGRMKFVDHSTTLAGETGSGIRNLEAIITDGGEETTIKGQGTGPIDGFVDALSKHLGMEISVIDYSEHTLRPGADASAICYMEVESGGKKLFGVGINSNIVAASLEALVSAVNRLV